ncbi:cupin domain-containing protein [Nostocaceae cyanobacterium CENA369]|uniref:Cupin domain-containing protein n=2 Tax=Dendronalium TaxID=2840442 RepID=A0A8J7I287_9NOST|nr:cupin domain-containing protein [Dendronalium phyllosphericum]MBH8572015.1 cupin domain-containing protein [Dendronalium phyllosphericum CENA369]
MILKSETLAPFNFEGLSILDFTAGLNTSSSVARISVLPNTYHRQAWSKRSDKYYYVLSGQLNFILDEQENILKAGDLCIVAQGQKFSYVNRTNQPVEILLIHTPDFDINAEVFEK